MRSNQPSQTGAQITSIQCAKVTVERVWLLDNDSIPENPSPRLSVLIIIINT